MFLIQYSSYIFPSSFNNLFHFTYFILLCGTNMTTVQYPLYKIDPHRGVPVFSFHFVVRVFKVIMKGSFCSAITIKH